MVAFPSRRLAAGLFVCGLVLGACGKKEEAAQSGGDNGPSGAKNQDLQLVPVDSEHSAVLQCLPAHPALPNRLILTASGGPLREWSSERVARATVEEALRHPTWRMGRKITIDSATLMNKGLEVIEAHRLFGVRADQIDVVIHPQSVVHSMVELVDGSVIAQLGITDMRLPIQYAFSYPERWAGPAASGCWRCSASSSRQWRSRAAWRCPSWWRSV